GDYTLRFQDCSPGQTWLQQTSDTQTVAAGGDTVIHVTLHHGATVSGHVKDAKGADVTDACVQVQAVPFGPPSIPVHTDSSGNYTIGGLPAGGSYEVYFSDCHNTGSWRPEWYSNAHTPADAKTVDSSAGSATGIDAQLEPAATITGTVTDSANHPLAGICVA